jgi:ABC-type antimicrobial peptide transport system permease subunit
LFYSILLMVFAAVAFLLAASGVYASMTYVVGQRSRELGIRLALGGRPATLLRMVLRRGAVLTLIGVALGTSGAIAMSRLLSSLLFGVTATDPTTFAAVTLMLGAVAMLACYLPARRAAGSDPLQVLRAE